MKKRPEPKDSGRKFLPWYHLKFPHMRTLKLCNGSTRQRLLVISAPQLKGDLEQVPRESFHQPLSL